MKPRHQALLKLSGWWVIPADNHRRKGNVLPDPLTIYYTSRVRWPPPPHPWGQEKVQLGTLAMNLMLYEDFHKKQRIETLTESPKGKIRRDNEGSFPLSLTCLYASKQSISDRFQSAPIWKPSPGHPAAFSTTQAHLFSGGLGASRFPPSVSNSRREKRSCEGGKNLFLYPLGWKNNFPLWEWEIISLSF